MPRPHFNLTTLLAWFVLLPASAGAVFEGARHAADDNARAMLGYFFASGAILGACIGYSCGRSVIKSALYGLLIWPAIACLVFIICILYNGSLIITVY